MRAGTRLDLQNEDLLAIIEAIHAAGLDEALWSRTLESITNAFNGVGTTLEIFDKKRRRHLSYYFSGLPPAHQIEYAEQYLPISPRFARSSHWPNGHIGWEYQFIDEAEMRRHPFYEDFLPRIGIRYCVGGVLWQTPEEMAVLAIQHSAKHGHVDKSEIALMRRLLPHVQQAFDVTRRLKRIGAMRQALEHTLDWLADGAALIGRDGTVLHANKSFETLVRRKDSFRLKDNAIEFLDAASRDKFNAALASALRGCTAKSDAAPACDFAAARSGGGPSYLVSVRPLAGAGETIVLSKQPTQAVALVFIRDPVARDAAPVRTLRELFGLTEAEAALALALQSGVTLTEYGRRRGLSVNTVYTHLRRLREKTGCSRMPELIHKLNELRLPLRRD